MLCKAWKIAINRFSVLRSRYYWNDNLIQIIDKYHENTEFFKYIEFDNNLGENEIESEVQALKLKDRSNIFKLDEGNLLRILLIKIHREKYACIMSYHHTILDGWSLPILTNFVYENYLNLLDNQEIEIIEQDSDYINVQKYLQVNTNYEYWHTKLNEIEENIDLKPFHKIKNETENFNKFNKEKIEVKFEQYNKLKKLNSLFGITTNALFQFIWHKIFSIYSNTKQTIIGTTVSGRNIPVPNVEKVVGCFINTLPLIVNHQNNDINVIDKIKEIQENIHELNINSNVKLAKLKSNGNKLFDILFVYENFPENKKNKIDQLNIIYKDSDSETDLDFYFNISIIIIEDKILKSFIIELKYSNKFEESLIKDTILLFDHILTQVIDNPNQMISELNYLIPSQEIKLLKEWNDTDMDYPQDKLMNGLFEETVVKNPKNIAVVYEDIELTYEELNEKSNQLSNYLRNTFNIKPDDIIALCLDKSELMIITILAVWKSGAAYVPMDPNFPDKRIEYILNDTKNKIIITKFSKSVK